MHKYENLVLMGQDIAEHGGVFKVTEGLAEEFWQGAGTQHTALRIGHDWNGGWVYR